MSSYVPLCLGSMVKYPISFSKWTWEIEMAYFKILLQFGGYTSWCLNTWSLVGGAILRGLIAFGKLNLVGGRGMLGLGPWDIWGPDCNMRAYLSQLWVLVTVPCPFLPRTFLLNKASHSQTGCLNIFVNLWLALDATVNSPFFLETWFSSSVPFQPVAPPGIWSLKILLNSCYLTFISHIQSI